MGQIGYLSPVPRPAPGVLPPPSQWFHDRVTGPLGHPAPLWEDASANPPAAVAALLASAPPPTVLVASTTPTLQAAIAGAPGIPIVGVGIADDGLFGGRVTGVASLTPAQSPMLARLLRAVPGLGGGASIAIVYEAGNASKEAQKNAIIAADPAAVGWAVGRPANWADVFHRISHAHSGAIVLSSPLTAGQAATLVPAANAFVQKTIFGGDGFGGGLMSYSPNRRAVYEQAADMAVQICKGAAVPPPVAPGLSLRVSRGRWAQVSGGGPFPPNLGGTPVIPDP